MSLNCKGTCFSKLSTLFWTKKISCFNLTLICLRNRRSGIYRINHYPWKPWTVMKKHLMIAFIRKPKSYKFFSLKSNMILLWHRTGGWTKLLLQQIKRIIKTGTYRSEHTTVSSTRTSQTVGWHTWSQNNWTTLLMSYKDCITCPQTVVISGITACVWE